MVLKLIERLIETDLVYHNLKWCFVNAKKVPFTYQGKNAKVNTPSDFCELTKLIENPHLNNYAGVGISIKASQIVAIDVDKCFSTPFHLESIDSRGLTILNLFKDYYIEFSFSGTGLRILFFDNNVYDFESTFYIKNSKVNVEIYTPYVKDRYVTITGQVIFNNKLKQVEESTIKTFLNAYMKREPFNANALITDITDQKQINLNFRKLIFKNSEFLNYYSNPFNKLNGNQSEIDFYLIKMLIEHVSSNYHAVRALMEQSYFYQSKDKVHLYKWQNGYFDRTFNKIKKSYNLR